MNLLQKARKCENLHIIFWLAKDSCWMLEFKWLGILMVLPTLSIAAFIVYLSRKAIDVYLNLAILFWICANSFWMYIEFFTSGELKYWASIPFALGFIFVGVYYFKMFFGKQTQV
jgi:hypothetical protein